MLFRLILFVLLAYFVWRILESTLKLMGRQNPQKGNLRGTSRMAQKPSQPPYRDIRDAEFEDITPKKEGDGKPPVQGS